MLRAFAHRGFMFFWLWGLVSVKIVLHAVRYGGSKGAYLNYTTGELTPRD